MSDRRYDEDEVAAIFRDAAAASADAPHESSREAGMTLAELQAIGREVGLAPEAVARAAHAVETRPRALARTFLGLPIGVERTVLLDRWMTDHEWELLVVELRDVFHASGRLSANGSFRQWRNGNLQALLEPTPTGHRLRLSTMKGNARASMRAGAAMLGVALVMMLTSALTGQLGDALPGALMLLVMAIVLLASGALQVPGWARRRGEQLDAIAAGVRRPRPLDAGP